MEEIQRLLMIMRSGQGMLALISIDISYAIEEDRLTEK